jgi:hypothetical protein
MLGITDVWIIGVFPTIISTRDARTKQWHPIVRKKEFDFLRKSPTDPRHTNGKNNVSQWYDHMNKKILCKYRKWLDRLEKVELENNE